MTRSLISMSLLVAAVTMMFGSTDAEARHCRVRNRCGCRNTAAYGGYQTANYQTANYQAAAPTNACWNADGTAPAVNADPANAPAPPSEAAPVPTDNGTAPKPAT